LRRAQQNTFHLWATSLLIPYVKSRWPPFLA